MNLLQKKIRHLYEGLRKNYESEHLILDNLVIILLAKCCAELVSIHLYNSFQRSVFSSEDMAKAS